MSEEPQYYTRKTLAEAAGISRTAFTNHEKQNVGRLMDIREKIPGLGIRYPAAKCRKYLALCAASGRRVAVPQP